MNFPAALDPFRSIRAVWRAVTASPGPLLAWWFGGLAAFVAIYLLVYLPLFLVTIGSGVMNHGQPAPWVFVVFACGGLLLFALMMVVQCLWHIGLGMLLLDTLRTGRCDLARAWSQRRRFFPVVGATLLVFLLAALAYVPFALGALVFAALVEHDALSPLLIAGAIALAGVWMLIVLYVFLGLTFVNAAAALDECGAFEAVARSWRAARGHRLALVWLLFVATLAGLSGLLLFCVGYVFTVALAALVPMEAYLALTRGEERKSWWISTGIPGEPGAESAPPDVTRGF